MRIYECYLNIKPCIKITDHIDWELNYFWLLVLIATYRAQFTVLVNNYSLLCVVTTAIFTICGNVFYSTEIINNESGWLINATVHVGNVSAMNIRLLQLLSSVEDITVIQRDNHNAATSVYSFNLIVQLKHITEWKAVVKNVLQNSH